MGYRDRKYLVYAVLGSRVAPPPWVERTWTHIFNALDCLIHVQRRAVAVRSTQLDSLTGTPNQRRISFGRIGWNELGSKRWTHAENGVLLSGRQAAFLNCEMWAPSWSICGRDGLAPDVYFSMMSEPNEKLSFSSTCLLAVASDLGQPDEAWQAADAIAATVQAVFRAHCIRQWGGHLHDGMLRLNAINDLLVSGLFKPGQKHLALPSLAVLQGTWAAF